MTKETKLHEKKARLTLPSEEKRKKDLQEYLAEISSLNVETARAQRFVFLVREWFADARPRFVEEYLRGVEKFVHVKQKDIVFSGRIDALYGNVIIEFEGNLTKKLGEAQEQLKNYAFCLLSSKEYEKSNFLCIAADGLVFRVYVPISKKRPAAPTKPEDIDLKEIDHVDFSTIDSNAAFFWIDRFLFRRTSLHPTTEQFVQDFGMNSHAYLFANKLLQAEWKRVHTDNEFKVIYENWAKYLLIAYGTTVADNELFLRHTYLASFAKLLAFMHLANKAVVPSEAEIANVFNGKFFKQLGIDNFLEEDFFSWIARDKVHTILVQITQRISTLLERYHLNEISEDVLKSLYQELVDPETRHDLGEFYTPDWLADRIVQHALKSNPEASVIDPSCGSGSFLYFAIRYKREMLGNSKDVLQHIRDSVVGIDIHPLAVIISKTNYLLGLGDLVRKRLNDFHIPVYMANSLKIPERVGQMSTEEKVPSMAVELDHTFVPFPEVFVEHPTSFDEAVDACHDFANDKSEQDFTVEQFRQFAKKRISEGPVDDITFDVLFTVAKRMHLLKVSKRDSIWAFILKNVYRPIFLRKSFDWILGNPPWLTYSDIEKGEYQQFVKNATMKTFGLLEKGNGHLITHMELGTLFFYAALNSYGKHGAQIGFVLPRSIFTSDQHSNFRKSSFGKAIHQTGLVEAWDLENVSPLFKVPACVIFGKHFHHTPRPLPCEIIAGTLTRKNSILLEAARSLGVRSAKLFLVQQGNRSFWSEDRNAEIAGTSPYAAKFAQGATIVPRTAWFVQILSSEKLGFNPETPYVKTDQRATDQAKEAYEDLIVEGNIEKEFLYATSLSTDLIPFAILDYRTVVLPIRRSKEKGNDTFIMVTLEDAKKDGFTYLAEWLNYCEKEWKSRRKEKAGKMSIYGRLDHMHGLTRQHYNSKYKIVYPSSATNLCSAVIPNQDIILNSGDQKIRLKNFVAESKQYYYETENKYEAHYLAAFLNAPFIDEKIKPMQSRGQWGPRDIHMKVWQLPIPSFNETKAAHKELGELGMECADRVEKLLPTLNTKDITPGKIGGLRNQVRELLSNELKEIDQIVRKIMKQ